MSRSPTHTTSPLGRNIVDNCTRGDSASLVRERASCDSVDGLAYVPKNSCFRTPSSTPASTTTRDHAIPVEKILFASKIIGAVRGIDAQIRNYLDDSKRYIEAVTILSAAGKRNTYEGNARRMFPPLDAASKAMAADRDAETNRQWINEIGAGEFGWISSPVKE